MPVFFFGGGGGGGTPGGANTQVQFNDSGAFGGDAGLIYVKATDALSVIGGADAVRLVLKGAASQTADLQQWQDSSSVVLTKVASDGYFTALKGVTIKRPSGAYGTSKLTIDCENHNNNPALTISNAGIGDAGILLSMANGGSYEIGTAGSSWYMNWANRAVKFTVLNNAYDTAPQAFLFTHLATPARVVMVLQGDTSQTADLQQWQNSATAVLSRINKDGYVVTAKVAAPADADLNASEMAYWLDDTIGATKAMFKAKDSAGTVRTGNLALT